MSGLLPYQGPKSVAGLPFTVPADFLGMTYHQYPGLTGAPLNVRAPVSQNHDYIVWGVSPTFWAAIEPNADGVYIWTALDAWVDAHWALGKILSFTNIFCPAGYSQNPTVDSSWTKPNGTNYKGAGGPLTAGGLTAFGNFITALIARYIARGKRFTYLQPWQEPNFPSTPGVGYWWGTPADLVDVAYVAYTAAKAADATITVLSPSVFINQMDQYVNATGTVNTTKHGYETCDRWAADQFNSGAPCFGQGLPAYVSSTVEQPDFGVRIPLFKLNTLSNPKPLVIASHGFDYVDQVAFPNACAAKMLQVSAQTRKLWLGRSLLYLAASGVSQVYLYTYDMGIYNGRYFCGDFVNDTYGVVAAVNEIAAYVVGKTIVSCIYYEGGPVSVTFSNGTSYSI